MYSILSKHALSRLTTEFNLAGFLYSENRSNPCPREISSTYFKTRSSCVSQSKAEDKYVFALQLQCCKWRVNEILLNRILISFNHCNKQAYWNLKRDSPGDNLYSWKHAHVRRAYKDSVMHMHVDKALTAAHRRSEHHTDQNILKRTDGRMWCDRYDCVISSLSGMVAAQGYLFICAHPRYASRLGLVDNRGEVQWHFMT